MKNIVMIFSIIFFLSGCVALEKIGYKYKHRDSSNVWADYGEPDEVRSDGKGGEIWRYEKPFQEYSPAAEYSQITSNRSSSNPDVTTKEHTKDTTITRNYQRETLRTGVNVYGFFIDQDGIVYQERHEKFYDDK
ncbi:MAG: hypothetical protein ABIH08_03490 [Candidatus Omnitrophota bacterium]